MAHWNVRLRLPEDAGGKDEVEDDAPRPVSQLILLFTLALCCDPSASRAKSGIASGRLPLDPLSGLPAGNRFVLGGTKYWSGSIRCASAVELAEATDCKRDCPLLPEEAEGVALAAFGCSSRVGGMSGMISLSSSAGSNCSHPSLGRDAEPPSAISSNVSGPNFLYDEALFSGGHSGCSRGSPLGSTFGDAGVESGRTLLLAPTSCGTWSFHTCCVGLAGAFTSTRIEALSPVGNSPSFSKYWTSLST
mmetsp:Transcript_7358/g.16091  ORF Transcript_7358/g.16091 Transcript_7358/m.16091 type:complete len:248 (+) Transcript_7358:75-818(+)